MDLLRGDAVEEVGVGPQSQDVVHATRGEMGLVSQTRANSLLNGATRKSLGKGGSQQILRRPRDIRRGGCERPGGGQRAKMGEIRNLT